MTVGELKALLSKYPDFREVLVGINEGDGPNEQTSEITSVDEREDYPHNVVVIWS